MRYDLDDRGEFAKHYQAAWLKKSQAAPHLWLRIAYLAYGMHGTNGHAPFKRRELATLLGPPGEPLPRQRLYEAITAAIEYGHLAVGSHSMCLRVRDDDIEKGRPDAKREPCRVCRRPTNRHG